MKKASSSDMESKQESKPRQDSRNKLAFTGHVAGSGLAVVELLFNYISMLRREGPQKWVYEELAEVAKTRFQFQEEEDATEYTERLASDMHVYKPPHILNGEFLHDTFDTRLVSL